MTDAIDLTTSLAALVEAANLDHESRSLLWGAYQGDAELAAAMVGETVDPPQVGAEAVAAPVWLSSIGVEGFRGIAGRAELLLHPQPGLTLVVGRNGSGKSSFAEALEALLTGSNARWHGRPAEWQAGWRNLHHDGPTVANAEFQLEGDDTVTELTRRWADSFGHSIVTGQRNGRPVDMATLGWERPLTNYKPLLSYNELGSMLEDRPSAIYDSMATVLGLEPIAAARERLRQARLEAEKPAKEVAKAKPVIVGDLQASGDQRAAAAVTLLSKRTPDLDDLQQLAFGEQSPAHEWVVALARLPSLDHRVAAQRAHALSEAVAHRAQVAQTDVTQSERVAGLLRQALDHHHQVGDGVCPVCGAGHLNQQWRSRARAEADGLEAASSELRAADSALKSARREALAAIEAAPVPPVLRSETVDLEVASTDSASNQDAAVAAKARLVGARWSAWCTPPAPDPNQTVTVDRDPGAEWSDDALIQRLGEAKELSAAVDELRDEAATTVSTLDDEWKPLARRLAAWVENARNARQASATANRLKTVEVFAKTAEATMRTDRFGPIAEEAGQLWAQLRQRSNVNLERVALQGQANKRRVDLEVTVDGSETSALGVMSQGELHALALALFLPRVTTDESPFRFLVVDDPVQAMDPARVDGLAQVLMGVAEARQVIVFTHDDRLPASCRRLGIPAEIIEITRQSESRVAVTVSASPAERAINDAYTLAKTERLPDSLKQRVVPSHCRRAVEALARDLAWRHLLASGKTHRQVDELMEEATTTTDILSLSLFGQIRRPDDVYWRLDELRPGTAKQVRFLNMAVHNPPADLNLEVLTRTVRRLLGDLPKWVA